MTAPTLTESRWPADASRDVLDLTTGDLLRIAAAESPEHLALVEVAPEGAPSPVGASRTDRRWTYAELLAEAESCARFLLDRFRPGERIVIWAPNIPEWVVLQYGAALAGIVIVTANPAFQERELRYVLERSRSSGIFHVDRFHGTDMAGIVAGIAPDIPELREVLSFGDWEREVRGRSGEPLELPVVEPTDPAMIQYTSGTTGFPKGALLPHRGVVTNARFIFDRLGFPTNGVCVSAMPLFHTAGCVMTALGALNTRSTYVMCQIFDPVLTLRALDEWEGQVLLGVPTMLIAMLDHPRLGEFDLSACDFVISGGAVVPAPLLRRVEETFECSLSTVYGQTELCPIVTQTRPDDDPIDKAGTIGQPLWQVEVKIADVETHETVPIGEPGEICARGYQTMIEYFDDPAATAETMSEDGWLHTGDLGSMDDRGFVTILGRLKDMIIRGGENIFAREIEDFLLEHPAIADVSVVGVPDELMGEVVAAVLRLRDPDVAVTRRDLRDFCRDHLAAFKTPAHWYVVDDLPITGSGKIQKFRVQQAIADGGYHELTD